MAKFISRVDGLLTEPPGRGVTLRKLKICKNLKIFLLYLIFFYIFHNEIQHKKKNNNYTNIYIFSFHNTFQVPNGALV